jgi:hypothetical protein
MNESIVTPLDYAGFVDKLDRDVVPSEDGFVKVNGPLAWRAIN